MNNFRGIWNAVERNALVVSRMICRATLQRNESRGAHYRKDYPYEDNDYYWVKSIRIVNKSGEIFLSTHEVGEDIVPEFCIIF